MTTPIEPNQPDLAQVKENQGDLLVEVKALAVAVSKLHNIFVKRTVLYWVLGIETVIVVAALVALAIFVGIENSNQNKIVNKAVGSCKVRNEQIDATRNYLAEQVKLQQESQGINAKFLGSLKRTFTPQENQQIVQLTKESQQALDAYFHHQPKDVNCAKLGQ